MRQHNFWLAPPSVSLWGFVLKNKGTHQGGWQCPEVTGVPRKQESGIVEPWAWGDPMSGKSQRTGIKKSLACSSALFLNAIVRWLTWVSHRDVGPTSLPMKMPSCLILSGPLAHILCKHKSLSSSSAKVISSMTVPSLFYCSGKQTNKNTLKRWKWILTNFFFFRIKTSFLHLVTAPRNLVTNPL